MDIPSPVTGNKVIFEQTILVSEIIKKYSQYFNINVSQYFGANQNISIYRCLDTGYRFFYPFDISGDGKFYEHFQQYDWYYMPWKWEHIQAAKFITSGMNVLEVGCGKGDFLKRIQQEKRSECRGLELNEHAANNARLKGIQVMTESIQLHAEKTPSAYDIVCSFQVLEHIFDVKSFITANVKATKRNGLIVFSVPNNNSFLKDDFNILNLPPHHLGLWNEQSLKGLENYFEISFERILIEPLQEYHQQYFKDTITKKLNKKFRVPIRILKIFEKFYTYVTSKNYQAFTILAVFRKQ